MVVGSCILFFLNILLIKSNNVISQKIILSLLRHRIVQKISFLMTHQHHISTCKIARTVALNNPIVPYMCLIEMKRQNIFL